MTVGLIDGRREANLWTGIGRYVHALRRWLPQVMAAESPNFATGSGFRLRLNGSPAPADLKNRLGKVTWEQMTLPWIVRRLHPTYLHLPWYEGPFKSGAALIVTVHDLDTVINASRYSRHFRMYYNGLLSNYVSTAAHIIVDSEATANDLESVFGRRKAVSVIYPGVDSEFENPDAQLGTRVLARLGLTSEIPVVVTGGGTGLRKNLQILGTAITMLKDSGLASALVVTGTRSLPPAFEPAVEAGAQIIPAGLLSSAELAGLYAAATVSVSPSLYEGFGFPVVESMAAGCPVIASNAGSLPEIAGGGALLFDPQKAADLANCLRETIRDAALRRRLSAAGRIRASRFRWSEAARSIAAVYRSV